MSASLIKNLRSTNISADVRQDIRLNLRLSQIEARLAALEEKKK